MMRMMSALYYTNIRGWGFIVLAHWNKEKGKRIYCCFIDYVKTFDSVCHLKLWLRLARCGITGKLLNVIIPPLPEGGGGILFYLCSSVRPSVLLSFHPSVLPSFCPSVCPSVLLSFRPVLPSFCPSVLPSFRSSKIFFVAFFSVTVDGRNLIFGHKHHIGIPYCG